MTPLRPTTPKELLRLKAASRRAVELAGDVTAVERITRVRKAALSKYTAVHETAYFMPVDVALDIDRDTGEPVILREMAALEGYDLAPRRGARNATGGNAMLARAHLVGRLTREVADVVAEVLAADADGVITPRERSALLKEIDEAQGALNAMRRSVETDSGEAGQ